MDRRKKLRALGKRVATLEEQVRSPRTALDRCHPPIPVAVQAHPGIKSGETYVFGNTRHGCRRGDL